MIAGVRGLIVAQEPAALIIDLHGFLIRVLTSGRTASAAGIVGDRVSLLTHLVVREDALTLYGFIDQDELDLFQLLLTVSGVGPRVALNLLSFDEPAVIYAAISDEDVKLLSRTPGIGKKIAEQIVFHLKRRLPETIPTAGGSGPLDTADREALAALEALGYTLTEARGALNAVQTRDGLTIEERVFQALQRLGNT
ncbi:MAG TPA: Holliday junction branch migration protein RuvA [Thermomicrobiales bacterium]|nr:Holliday junction branch migration protein RuvA [Chloroflexota bacterium]HQX63469.1 Holliday junction branch migration protein RuvA [Thermomicrobiales bacterium]HQZ89701.1 Holliday junction branch migration protein RuvA [Thermomicrobiales bacterium]